VSAPRRSPDTRGSSKGRPASPGGAGKSSSGAGKKTFSGNGGKRTHGRDSAKGYSGGAKKGRTGGARKGAASGGDGSKRYTSAAGRGSSSGGYRTQNRSRATDSSRRPPGGASARGADDRAGRPPRGGPRDPLVEEIRASTPKAKQESAIAAFEHARELLQRGRDGAAAQAAADAKRLAPRSGSVRELLGVALYRSGQYRDALRELQAYRRMTGRLDQNHLIADSYRGLGMPEKAVPVAVEAVRSRLREEPRAEAAVVGASALADLGRYDEAIGLLRAFPTRRDEAQPWDIRIWYVAGDVLARAGRTQEAAEEFRRVIRYDPGAFDAAERLAALSG
jgi:predicted Zn-dependent protease